MAIEKIFCKIIPYMCKRFNDSLAPALYLLAFFIIIIICLTRFQKQNMYVYLAVYIFCVIHIYIHGNTIVYF